MSSVTAKAPWKNIEHCFVVDFSEPDFVKLSTSIFKLGIDDVDVSRDNWSTRVFTSVSSDDHYSDAFFTDAKLKASYGCFSGSASIGVDKSSSTSKHTMRTDVKVKAFKYRVTGASIFVDKPETFLNDHVKGQIAEGAKTMEQLERLIGHFYCSACRLGGILKRSYIVEKSEKETSSTMHASLKASYGTGLMSASARASIGITTAKHNKNARMRFEEKCLGGDSTKWLQASDTTTDERLEEIQEEWANSVTDDSLYVFDMERHFSWELVKKINPTYGAQYEAYLKKKWAEQGMTGNPTEYVPEEYVPKGPSYFYLRNRNGHCLAVQDNNLDKGLCVWSQTEETGQLWMWDGKHIRSKLGAKYVAVSHNRGDRGAHVTLRPRNPDEQGQVWERTSDNRLQNGKGHYLTTDHNGGRGSHVCQWSLKDNQGGQLWDIQPAFGIYHIRTCGHVPSDHPAGWGLAAWKEWGNRNSISTWVHVHANVDLASKWEISPGNGRGTCRIKFHSGPGGDCKGYGLSAWHRLDDAKRDASSTWVAAHAGEEWPCDWFITQGKQPGTWKIQTFLHALGGQPEGWGLSAWRSQGADRDHCSTRIAVHQSEEWSCEWTLECA